MRAAVLCMLAACSFSPSASPDDARIATDVRPDARVLGRWGAPQRVAELDDGFHEDDPSLTSDLLVMYFDSDRKNGLGGRSDIYRATRASIASPWGQPQLVSELDDVNRSESTGKVSLDDSTLRFARGYDAPNGGWQIMLAQRAGSAPFMTTVDTALSSAGDDFGAFVSADGLTVVLCSDRLENEQYDLFIATRASATSPWTEPAQIAELSTQSLECDPMMPDASTLYFTSTRGNGTSDLYVATRQGGTFGPPMPIEELNEPGDIDRDAWVSPDQRTIFFSSTRDGDTDIYMATR